MLVEFGEGVWDIDQSVEDFCISVFDGVLIRVTFQHLDIDVNIALCCRVGWEESQPYRS